MKEKTFEEWLKENPEIEEELKKYEYKFVNEPPKFCWDFNLNTSAKEGWKLYKEGKIGIQSSRVIKKLTPYGELKLKEKKDLLLLCKRIAISLGASSKTLEPIEDKLKEVEKEEVLGK